MTTTTAAGGALFWSPRVMGILFAAFLSLFALDVFDETYGPWGTAGALLLHLVPTFVVIAALAVAWRWQRPGAVLFAALAALYVGATWGRFPLVTYLVIAGPLALIGALFLSSPKRA